MSDYGRFDRYGLPSSYDQWRLSPPPEYEYDDDEEESEEETQTYYCLNYADPDGWVWITKENLTEVEATDSNAFETMEEAQEALREAVKTGYVEGTPE